MMGFLFTIFLTLVLAVGGYGYYVTADLPPVETLLAKKAEETLENSSQVYAADNRTIILSNGRFRQEDTTITNVAPTMVNAILATEDRRFYSHNGVDPIGIARALISNLRNKGVNEGASTITQQLARNLFLTNERSFKRKFREMVLAYQLEQALSKDQILERYLNTIYFGEGAYGIEAASTIYFSRSARNLTLAQAALLAGMPQAPSRYNPFVNPELALKRRNEVLQNLVESGKVSQAEADAAKNQPLGLNPPPNRVSMGDKVPHFNRYVQQQLMSWFGLSEQEFWQSGFKVYTTLDLRGQRLAEQAVQQLSARYGRTGKGQEAALVALNASNGAILAYVGGKDFNDSQYDRVSLAVRSPGSLFKAFTYAAALEKGYQPTDVMVDEPVSYGNWTPRNFSAGHYGAMTLARAFATSNNIIAVKLLYEIGPQTVVDLAHQMGVNSELKPFLSLTLGGSGVTLLEMAGAFQTIANQGVYIKPYAIERIVDSEGEVVYSHEPAMRDALSPTSAHTMIRMMQEVVASGTGTRAAIGRPQAGKTGTSDDFRDAWFVGFTPNVVTGVWVGNDNNQPMSRNVSGATMPTELWKAFMQPYASLFPLKDFNTDHSRDLEGGAATAGGDGLLQDEATGNAPQLLPWENGELPPPNVEELQQDQESGNQEYGLPPANLPKLPPPMNPGAPLPPPTPGPAASQPQRNPYTELQPLTDGPPPSRNTPGGGSNGALQELPPPRPAASGRQNRPQQQSSTAVAPPTPDG